MVSGWSGEHPLRGKHLQMQRLTTEYLVELEESNGIELRKLEGHRHYKKTHGVN